MNGSSQLVLMTSKPVIALVENIEGTSCFRIQRAVLNGCELQLCSDELSRTIHKDELLFLQNEKINQLLNKKLARLSGSRPSSRNRWKLHPSGKIGLLSAPDGPTVSGYCSFSCGKFKFYSKNYSASKFSFALPLSSVNFDQLCEVR